MNLELANVADKSEQYIKLASINMTRLTMEVKIESSTCNKFNHPEDGCRIFYQNQEDLHSRIYFTSFSE